MSDGLRLGLVAVLALAFAGGRHAAAQDAPHREAEAGTRLETLDQGLDDTVGGYVRARHAHEGVAWLADVTWLDRLDDSGTQFTAAHSRTFGPDWLGSLSVATSAGGFFWPRLRVDGRVGRRWLDDKRLVTWTGFGYYDAKDEHEDVNWNFEAAYYFEQPWILMGGAQVNNSSPGSVTSASGFVAATYGRDRQRYVTARYGTGNQAYQPLTPDAAAVDFPFHQSSVTWREWYGPSWGVNVVVDGFVSDVYDQAGIELGLFAEF